MRRLLMTCATVLTLVGCSGEDDAGQGAGGGGSGGSGAMGGGAGASAGGSSGAAGSAGAAGSVDDGGGSDGGDPFGFTSAEWAAINTLSPLPAVPPDPTNKYADDANAAKLGQMLFFDKSISGALAVGDDGTNGGLGAVGEAGKVACASCHLSPVMDDDRSKPNNVSLGTDYGTRNAPSLVNSSFYAWTNWGGRFDSQWSLSPAVVENPKIMKSSRLQIAHLMWDKYKAEYDAIFPAPLDPALAPDASDAKRFPAAGKPKASASDPDGPWEQMTEADRKIVNTIFANYGKAIQAYLRLLVSREAPFDKYVAGDFAAIGADAKRGLRLFIGTAKCVTCHSGPNFSDDGFHALAVKQIGPHVPATDTGRYGDVPALLASPFNTAGAFSDDTSTGKLTGLTQDLSQTGKFRTKSLRGVASSAPYMHAGQHATLADVVAFYAYGGGSDGGVPSELTPFSLNGSDADDLVAFLKTLDGEAPSPTLLQDTSK